MDKEHRTGYKYFVWGWLILMSITLLINEVSK